MHVAVLYATACGHRKQIIQRKNGGLRLSNSMLLSLYFENGLFFGKSNNSFKSLNQQIQVSMQFSACRGFWQPKLIRKMCICLKSKKRMYA